MRAGGEQRRVGAALTTTNIRGASRRSPNIARGAEHTVAGCRYQCYQRRGLARAPPPHSTPPSAAGPGPRSSIVHLVSLHLLGWGNVTGPSRAGGMSRE